MSLRGHCSQTGRLMRIFYEVLDRVLKKQLRMVQLPLDMLGVQSYSYPRPKRERGRGSCRNPERELWGKGPPRGALPFSGESQRAHCDLVLFPPFAFCT